MAVNELLTARGSLKHRCLELDTSNSSGDLLRLMLLLLLASSSKLVKRAAAAAAAAVAAVVGKPSGSPGSPGSLRPHLMSASTVPAAPGSSSICSLAGSEPETAEMFAATAAGAAGGLLDLRACAPSPIV